MLCPFRLHTVEYQKIIGQNEKGDIVANIKDEMYMPCDPNCCYAKHSIATDGNFIKENIICRRAK